MKKIGTLLLLAVLLSLMCASAVAAVKLDVSGNNYYDIYPTGYSKNGGSLQPVLGSNDYILTGTWDKTDRAAITFHSLTPLLNTTLGTPTYNVVFQDLKITGGSKGAISFGDNDYSGLFRNHGRNITLNVTDYTGTNELEASGAAFVYNGLFSLTVNIAHKHSTATLNVSNNTTSTNQPIVISGNNATVNANGIQYTAGSAANKTTQTMKAVTLSNRADQLNKTNEKPATCEDDGNIAYWSCTVAGCGVICSDAAGTKPISMFDTRIPAGHKLQNVARNEATCTRAGNKEYWECKTCNKKYSDAQATNEINDVTIPAHGLTYHAAVDADCTTDGNKEYWECNTCNIKYSDDQATNVITDVVIPRGHDLKYVPEVPSTCKDEGFAAHYACKRPSCEKLFRDADGTDEISIDELKLPLSANHDIKPVDATPATCNDPGLDAHFECSICGLKYKDASGTTPITEEDIVAPPLGHHFDPAWYFDEEGHWHMCRQPLPQRTRSTNHICGELSQKEPHTFAWVVDKESTTDAAGQRHEECTVCGYKGGMEELPKIDLPATGDSSHLMRWAALLGVCCAGLAGMARRKRK